MHVHTYLNLNSGTAFSNKGPLPNWMPIWLQFLQIQNSSVRSVERFDPLQALVDRRELTALWYWALHRHVGYGG
ncbi:hypothetical protein CEXT_339671 [Caerostris extrusa]|uniref:Uncharacterized protein n=1 Tax=Caerostris extrusa TaxID=172846 RepID=A0AAV4XQ92_CAEEX|nr:hypothetical protein CEXT_339671 [Caerostris extrusa]